MLHAISIYARVIFAIFCLLLIASTALFLPFLSAAFMALVSVILTAAIWQQVRRMHGASKGNQHLRANLTVLAAALAMTSIWIMMQALTLRADGLMIFKIVTLAIIGWRIHGICTHLRNGTNPPVRPIFASIHESKAMIRNARKAMTTEN